MDSLTVHLIHLDRRIKKLLKTAMTYFNVHVKVGSEDSLVLNAASQREDPYARVVVHRHEILPSEIDEGDTVPFYHKLQHIRIIVLISTYIPDVARVCITGTKRTEQYNTILYNYHGRAKVCSFISSH
jgi:hypothetical protein